MSAKQKEREAMIKAYFDELRKTARERLEFFADRGEAQRNRGHHPAVPPLEILNFPDLLGRAWGWDSLMPCFSLHHWAQYKKYLHDYYTHNRHDLNLNGDDGDGLAALADSCIMMEGELMAMMKRHPKIFNDDDISLSNKIISHACQVRNNKCSEFPAAAVALKCITKEADLMCELVWCGWATSTLIFCGSIRKHALSFMTYKKPQHVAAVATMMATTKEANLIYELLKNESDDKGIALSWSKTVWDGALRAMVKIFDECSEEKSAMSSIAENLVFGESDDKICSMDELVQYDNVLATEKIHQETKEDGVEGNYLGESEEQKMEVQSVKEDNRMNQTKHRTDVDVSELPELIKIPTDEKNDETD